MPLPRVSDLTMTDFDSAALRGTAIIAHRMNRPGRWRLSLHTPSHRSTVNQIIKVVENGPPMLAVGTPPDAGRYAQSASEGVLAPGGHLRLQAPAGGSVFGQIYPADGDQPVWDSRALEPGDHYILLPMRPGRYRMANQHNAAHADLVIRYPDPRGLVAGRRLATDSVCVVAGDAFAPSHLSIDPGQPVAIEFTATRGQVVLTLVQADDGPSDLAEWRARHEATVLQAFMQRTRKTEI